MDNVNSTYVREWIIPNGDITKSGYSEDYLKDIYSNPIIYYKLFWDNGNKAITMLSMGDTINITTQKDGVVDMSNRETFELVKDELATHSIVKTVIFDLLSLSSFMVYTDKVILTKVFETEREFNDFVPPIWFGVDEITGKKEYSEFNLAKPIVR